MRDCFKLGLYVAVFAAAAGAAPPQSVQYRSVIRTDAKGHLVRAVVVSPRTVVPRTIPSAVPVEAAPAAVPADTKAGPEVQQIIEQAASRHEVDPLLVHSVIQVESAYNPRAVSNKGAQGLMQLIPSTARRFGASDAFDVRQNVEAGVKYLKYLTALFPDDLRLTLAAYNAGEGAVWKYGNNVPPYRETENYVYKVGQRYGKARKHAEQIRKAAKPEPKLVATEPRYQPIQSFLDAEGRLHLRTVPESQSTP